MSFREKSILVSITAMLVATAVYLAVLLPSLATTSVNQVLYQVPMIIAVVSLIIITVVGQVAVAVHDARAASAAADERERLIGWRGQSMGGYVLAVGVFLALCLAMVEVEWFWIANALAGMWVLAEVFSGVAQLVMFRRGV